MGEVESLEGHYAELQSKLNMGLIGSEEFREQVAKLWFEDDQGHTWMIGTHTGNWYVYRKDQWVQDEPPRIHHDTHTIACPQCHELVPSGATFCGHCGMRIPAPPPPPAVTSAPRIKTTPVSIPKPSAPVVPSTTGQSKAASANVSTPPTRRAMPRRLLVAASGAGLFAILFLCLGGIGVFVLWRNTANANPVAVAIPPTPSIRPTVSALSTRTPTPNAAATNAAATAIARATATPTTPPPNVTIVPTPIIVYIDTPISSAAATPLVVVIETPTPTHTAAPSIAQVTTPTATPTPTSPPADTPIPTDTPVPTPIVPTNTPQPPADTPTPRPPTATPTSAVVVSGHIAFTIFNPGYPERRAYDTYIAAVDGSGRHVAAAKRRQIQYSPNGLRLVTRGMENEKEKLWIRDLTTGGEVEITNTPIEAAFPSWSPDGNSILYSSTELADRQSRLYIVNSRGAPDSRQWLKFGAVELIGRYPTWLQNGQIVYVGCDKWANSGQCGIIRVNPDGNAPTMLTSNARDGVDTAPSGRGNTVVFMSNHSGNWDIYSIPLNGGEARDLSNNPADDGLPTISPDGQFIAFVSNRSGQWAVWVMRLDGSEQRQLFTLGGSFATGADIDWTTERISWGP